MISGLRAVLGPVLVCAAFAQAPFQCASKVNPDERAYEDPSEVLYGLAGKFKAMGDQRAYVETLRYVVDRYPASRFARMAQQDLADVGAPKPAGSAE